MPPNLPNQISEEVKQERFERLAAAQLKVGAQAEPSR